MTDSKKLPVIAAAAAIVILAGWLGVRALGLQAGEAGVDLRPAPASVAEPAAVDVATLEIPAWHQSANRDWTLEFKTDLDLLAPLGDGAANAGPWFAQFEKERGPRAAEAAALMERRVEHEVLGQILPFDDPLLAEAEPWCDQATMRFYPDVFPIEGYETRLPNLLVPLALARTWVARGLAADDHRAAMEDFRRAIRLGRLLRQEDAVLISDLVGLECIRLGAWGVFMRNRTVDPELALLASVTVGEAAPQKLLSSERITKVNLQPYARRLDDGAVELDAPDAMLVAAEKMIRADGDRRFKGEAVFTAQILAAFGSDGQRERASRLLAELATGPDEILSPLARWAENHDLERSQLAELLGLKE